MTGTVLLAVKAGLGVQVMLDKIDPCPTCAIGVVCRTPICGRSIALQVRQPTSIVDLIRIVDTDLTKIILQIKSTPCLIKDAGWIKNALLDLENAKLSTTPVLIVYQKNA